MTIKRLFEAWLSFLFTPESPIGIALFRIFLGILLLQSALIHVGADFLTWYGPRGVISFESIKTYWWLNQPHFDLLLLFPPTETGALTFWTLYIIALIMLTIGLWSRVASVVVLLCIISLHTHQPFNLNGGDAMLRLYCGYLIFSDSGAALSFDRLIQRYRQPTFGEASLPKLIAPWGQRMIQIQLAIAYWSTFGHKIAGSQWLDGTAVYFATRLEDMQRSPNPILYDNLFMCKLLTWFTLIVEGAMFSLVWLRDLRYPILLGAVALHLGIDSAINLPVFEWTFIAGLVTFVFPEDFGKAMSYIQRRINKGFGLPERLYYATGNQRETALASVLEGLDVFKRLEIIGSDEKDCTVHADTKYGELHGLSLFSWLSCRLPLLWFVYPFTGLLFQATRRPRNENLPGDAA